MDVSLLKKTFEAAMPYQSYVASGNENQQRQWLQVYQAAQLSTGQTELVQSFQRQMKILIISGIWCGDCAQQCPLAQRIAEAAPEKLDLRFVDRDEHADLSQKAKINGGVRVPVALFLAEDYELCSVFGDRSLNRYRAMASKQLGAACPVAIAPPDADELKQTLQDWLDEHERIQLMLRLSARLREKHGD